MLLALLALLQGPAPVPSPDAAPAPDGRYDGRARQLNVNVPRRDVAVKVDGVLDEPIWGEAAVLQGFSHFQPIEGEAAQDSTEVLVWYSPTAIHFGIRAREPHGEVHATLADRDKIFSDDVIQLLIGTFNDSRQAFLFAVNPYGVQGDGVMVERGNVAGGGFAGGTQQAREGSDLSPDYVFESKGRLVEGGYEIEIRIPFKSLRYQSGDEQTWQLHVLRKVQHSGFEDSWVPAERAKASFLAQSGRLGGLKDIKRGLTLDFTPEVTGHLDGSRTATGRWDYDRTGPDIGGTVRWGITNNLSLNATANPDYSQVESDVNTTQFDPRDAVFFPEKRPFFLDGLEQFQTPFNLAYTRRVVQPVAAVKLTGKAAGTNIGLISAVDNEDASATGDNHPIVNIIRLQKDVASGSRLGLVYTDRVDGDNWNRVGAVDGRLAFGKSNFVFQAGLGKTHEFGNDLSGPIWQGRFTHAADRFLLRYQASGIDPDFRTRSGFVNRTGDANVTLTNMLIFKGKPGSFVESFTPDITLNGAWTYDSLVHGGGVRDPKFHVNLNTTLRGGWSLGFSLLLEKFGYDPRIYGNYQLEVPGAGGVGLDTIPFTGGNQRIPNRDYVFTVNTPQWKNFSASLFTLIGQDENFYEWASANLGWYEIGLNWRPTNQIRVEGHYLQIDTRRRSDGTLAGRQRIPRVKVEYQIARPLFVRVVGDYFTEEVDALRDEGRTQNPILINGVKTTPTSTNVLRGDVLLSFVPTPGTVFFAGYGSTMLEPRSLKFQNFERVSDGFFLKASYLFRMGG
jgi:hypothetical protein